MIQNEMCDWVMRFLPRKTKEHLRTLHPTFFGVFCSAHCTLIFGSLFLIVQHHAYVTFLVHNLLANCRAIGFHNFYCCVLDKLINKIP